MSQHSSVKIVVVGAGLAGLAAAAALLQAGFKNVQILEAMGRPGGRVHTTRPFDDNKIEMGANWIHGQKGNPLYALAKKRGFLQDETRVSGTVCLPGSVSPRDYFFHQDGRQIPVNVVKQVRSLFSKLTAKAFECGLDQRYKDFSLGHYLDDAFGRSPLAASEDGRRVYEWCKRTECTDEACSSLYDVSAIPQDEYKALKGEFYNCLGPRGYQAILDTLLEALPFGALVCDRAVQRIHWALEGELHPTKLLCKNGDCFKADHVIVTVPLGFLKEHAADLFEPALPEPKTNAIHRLGFGTVDKIYLRFEERFWPEDCAGIQLVWDAGPEKEGYSSESQGDKWKDTWYKKICGFDTVDLHPNVLCGWITGREALHMESLNEKTVGEVCVRLLKSATGWVVPDPVQVLLSKWGTEPYVKGSYSFIPQGVNAVQEQNALAAPLPQKGDSQQQHLQVLFAGEATHLNFYTTTHGAYMSGLREAQKIIDLYL